MTALLRRWAETAAAAALAAFCLWVGVRAGLAGGWLGWGLAAVGAAAAVWARAAFSRARLGPAGPAPGVVQVDERRVAYLGPVTGPFPGGVAALDDLAAVSAERDAAAAPVWRLELAEGGALLIPAGARGAERLPEAFAALPGFSPDRAAAAFAAGGSRTIWRRAPAEIARLPRRR